MNKKPNHSPRHRQPHRVGIRSLALAAYIAATSVSGLADSSAPKPMPQSSAAQRPATDQRGTDQSPLVVNITAVPSPTEEERREKADERRDKAESDSWLLRLTGALVAATVALVVATAFLWNATKKLVKGTEDTAKRQLRAYISVSRASISRFDDANGVEVEMVFKNFGVTPAYGLSAELQISYGPFPAKFNFDNQFTVYPISRSIVGPGMELASRLRCPQELSEKHIANLRDGQSVIYVFGFVHYIDAFGISRVCKVRYGAGGNIRAAEGCLIACQDGNEEYEDARPHPV
jgi:hypothetical protein